MQNNYYHVLPKRFHLNGHIIGFLSQTQKLDQCYKPPSFSLVYLPTISKSNAFSSCHDWNFLTFLMIFLRLPKVSENVRRSSEGLFNDNILVSCDKKRLFGLFLGIVIKLNFNLIFVINHVLKNNSSGFVSQAWEIVLDAWDWCLKSAGVRLTHNAWELAGILSSGDDQRLKLSEFYFIDGFTFTFVLFIFLLIFVSQFHWLDIGF